MLEWHAETRFGWSKKTGAYGRGLKKLTRPDLWTALEATYACGGIEENWQALFRTIDLFQNTAVEVGEALGYEYPSILHARVVAYLNRVRALEPGAQRF
jgi:aminoglycoside 6-adenylyltransferase